MMQVKIDTECKLQWRSHYTLKNTNELPTGGGNVFIPSLKSLK